MWRLLPLLVALPVLLGFDSSDGREALDRAFHNLYGVNVLAAVEMTTEGGGRLPETLGLAYGRKTKGGEVRTLLFTLDRGREGARALLFQRVGERDRMFVADGRHGRVRPVSSPERGSELFSSEFGYDDFRAHTADEYEIEPLGRDAIDGEPAQVLRLRPHTGPYQMLLVWLSSERPVFLRIDYFDRRGLLKRYTADRRKIRRHFEWHVPMRDEMLNLRRGTRTTRVVRNILVDTDVPDEMFSLVQLSRGRLPSF